MNIGLLIAGGIGQRMGQEIPKQFININDKPVIIYTLEAFQNHPDIDAIAVVCLDGWHHVLDVYAKQFNITKLKYIVSGGENGQGSIRNGVYELEKHFGPDDIVLIQWYLKKSFLIVFALRRKKGTLLPSFLVLKQCLYLKAKQTLQKFITAIT